jgi:hypothetical protein
MDDGSKKCMQNLGAETSWKPVALKTGNRPNSKKVRRLWGWEADGTGSGSRPVVGFGISDKPLNAVTSVSFRAPEIDPVKPHYSGKGQRMHSRMDYVEYHSPVSSLRN